MRTLLFLCLFQALLFAEVDLLKDHLIHEAFFPSEQNTLVLSAVPVKPPADLSERIPENHLRGAVWIPGYWEWSEVHRDYVWVSGTWRLPPPGHVWISGKWKAFDEGWVWLKGFWSAVEEKDLAYLSHVPPDGVDERVKNPPGQDYFWIRGHWRYNEESRDFVWFQGRWQEFNAHWQYVPARYVWREKGYVFIDGFWDWSVEERGTAYPCVVVPQEERDAVVYTPHSAFDAATLVHLYAPYWPDYSLFFHRWFFYHPDFDFGWGHSPPWWGWNEWWAFNDADLWWLWWWWSHPGFPHPFFINAVLADLIQPPGDMLVKRMHAVVPPPFVLDSGVVGLEELINAIEEVTHKREPILPADRLQRREIADEAFPRTKPPAPLRPTGSGKIIHPPEKPFFGPTRQDFTQPIERTKALSYPKVTLPQSPKEVVKPRHKPLHRTQNGHTPPPSPPTPPPQRRRPLAPDRYIPRNNTRMRPPHPENWPSRQERSRTPSSAQSYQPRRTPQRYEPQRPTTEKKRYVPEKTAPKPHYTPPPKRPTHTDYKQSTFSK